jgi:hypothetical protein
MLVPTGHSCQGDARTIAEVRRILLMHLRECKASWSKDVK